MSKFKLERQSRYPDMSSSLDRIERDKIQSEYDGLCLIADLADILPNLSAWRKLSKRN